MQVVRQWVGGKSYRRYAETNQYVEKPQYVISSHMIMQDVFACLLRSVEVNECTSLLPALQPSDSHCQTCVWAASMPSQRVQKFGSVAGAKHNYGDWQAWVSQERLQWDSGASRFRGASPLLPSARCVHFPRRSGASHPASAPEPCQPQNTLQNVCC